MVQIIKIIAKKKVMKANEKLNNVESTNVISQDTISWLGKVAGDVIQLLN